MRKKSYVLLTAAWLGMQGMAFSLGEPVFDAEALLESVRQTANQMQQIELQKNTIQNLVQNTQSMSSFNWGNPANATQNIISATDTLSFYKNQAGGLERYLNRYQSQAFYKNNTLSQDAIKTRLEQGSEAEIKAHEAVLKGIDKQQLSIQQDAKHLEDLQKQVQTAQGQKAASQAQSQINSANAQELLQIRALLIAQQNAQATKDAVLANEKAIRDAKTEQFLSGHFTKSTPRSW